MMFQTTEEPSGIALVGAEAVAEWQDVLSPAIEMLRKMAGTTENEFLQIGSMVQDFYQRSRDITLMSNQLVGMVSGDTVRSLAERLNQMMTDMDVYLADSRSRSNDSCSTLEQVQSLLGELSAPLQSFQKMNKTLRMLSISTKIESARLGDMGGDFVNLAMDVEKLSHQVSDKSAAILAHSQLLATILASNISMLHTSKAAQDGEVVSFIKSTASSLQELVSLNERCTHFGALVSTISTDVTDGISEIVASLQMHDMTRQQVEHIVEALESLISGLTIFKSPEISVERWMDLIVESGDVCELQEAQLRFASAELYGAVSTIVVNLHDVARKQLLMVDETRTVAGVAADSSSGTSFADVIYKGMTAITTSLSSCASADREMKETMEKVALTIRMIASFVADIEAIGSEIELIALNAQVKAAHTGLEGAALGVLAEAIKRLSDEAVRQSNSVAATLKTISSVTENLSLNAENQEQKLSSQILFMQDEAAVILRTLAGMNDEMAAILSVLSARIDSLTGDVEETISGIDVHELTKSISDGVLQNLAQIVVKSRSIVPASTEFKEHLRHMEEHYTMESERHIHEGLARKRSGLSPLPIRSVVASVSDTSEFGDNVDLF